MLQSFLILIGCQLAGEVIIKLTNIPVPGAVLGMIILFIALLMKRTVPNDLNITSNALIKYIGLLFVPAGAGISMYLGLIAEEWDVILIASAGSTIITLIICAGVFQFMNKGDRNGD